MEHDEDCNCRRCHHPVLRIIAAIVIFVIVIAIVSKIAGSIIVGNLGTMMAGSGWNLLWDIIGLLFLIWLISWVVSLPWHHYDHEHWGTMGGDRAVRILRRRYAKGEINESEFKKMIKNLKEK